jgi:hypothetical protein
LDLVKYGARTFWTSVTPETDLPQELNASGGVSISAPRAHGIGVPIAGLLPLQLLSVQTAVRLGQIPADFKIIGKMTLKE